MTRAGVLKSFAFVSHGADDNTTATIAASAATNKAEDETGSQSVGGKHGYRCRVGFGRSTRHHRANYENKNGKKATVKAAAADPFELASSKPTAYRDSRIRRAIRGQAKATSNGSSRSKSCALTPSKRHGRHGIPSRTPRGDGPSRFSASSRASRQRRDQPHPRSGGLHGRRLGSDDDLVKKHRFTDQELQLAHDKFKGRIGLKQLMLVAAEAQRASRQLRERHHAGSAERCLRLRRPASNQCLRRLQHAQHLDDPLERREQIHDGRFQRRRSNVPSHLGDSQRPRLQDDHDHEPDRRRDLREGRRDR